MPIYIIESAAFPGSRYHDRIQRAPDFQSAIRQFLTLRANRYTLLDLEKPQIPVDCNLVYELTDTQEVLVAAFQIPLGLKP